MTTVDEQQKMTKNDESIPFIERLHLDEMANQMAMLKTLIADALEVNQTKITAIKEAISSHQYQIQSHAIAAKLLEHAPLRKRTVAEPA